MPKTTAAWGKNAFASSPESSSMGAVEGRRLFSAEIWTTLSAKCRKDYSSVRIEEKTTQERGKNKARTVSSGLKK